MAKMRRSKYMDWALNILVGFMLTVVCLILYWSLAPYNIIKYNIDHFEMTKDTYTVGEPLTFRNSFCKQGHYQATQIRRLHDGVIYLYPTITTSTDEGCFDFISSSSDVPNVPSGVYTYEIEIIYRPNPIREIKYTMSSEEFTIVNDIQDIYK